MQTITDAFGRVTAVHVPRIGLVVTVFYGVKNNKVAGIRPCNDDGSYDTAIIVIDKKNGPFVSKTLYFNSLITDSLSPVKVSEILTENRRIIRYEFDLK